MDAYSQDDTALLIIDAYNDLVCDGGKVWPA
jgi:hypothetical protein